MTMAFQKTGWKTCIFSGIIEVVVGNDSDDDEMLV